MEMAKYRNLGIKLTPQRLAIFNFLDGNKNHPSADDIFNAVKKEYPTMSFATVYNTMDALKSKGAIRELTIESGKKRYDPDCLQHHHLICVECKVVVDIFKKFNLSLSSDTAKSFDIKGTHIEFYGLCKRCKILAGKKH
jgi:Fur family peroxide stress response transcriptional regulator